MESKEIPSASFRQPQQTCSNCAINEHGFRSMKGSMQTDRPKPWCDKAVNTPHQINDEIRENNVGASDEGVSVGDRDISTYAMMHKQGFDGMKDFMESHGLRIWNDEYAQTAHEIIEKMREFDEKYYHLSKSAQESDSDDVRGEIIEDELRGQNWVENTFNDLQDEELFNGVDYAPEGLESGGIGGSDGCSENIKEGFNTLGFGGEGGYSNNAFDEGGYIRYDHDGGDNRYDYGGNDYDGYDCDDGYDYDGNYD